MFKIECQIRNSGKRYFYNFTKIRVEEHILKNADKQIKVWILFVKYSFKYTSTKTTQKVKKNLNTLH